MNKTLLKYNQRKGQRKRIANLIKDIRTLSESRNKKDALISIRLLVKNYPKLKKV